MSLLLCFDPLVGWIDFSDAEGRGDSDMKLTFSIALMMNREIFCRSAFNIDNHLKGTSWHSEEVKTS
jgi:hypothetical protein